MPEIKSVFLSENDLRLLREGRQVWAGAYPDPLEHPGDPTKLVEFVPVTPGNLTHYTCTCANCMAARKGSR
jgi:hypothetical protein